MKIQEIFNRTLIAFLILHQLLIGTIYAQHNTTQHNTTQHNYVISLKTEQQRRKHIEREFGKQHISFSFFDAVIPAQIDELSKKFNITFNRSSKATLCDNEIACALSHISLWNIALENNLDYINIFEDDIYLGENAKELLVVDYLPQDTDVLKLEAHGIIIFDKGEKIKFNREISQLKFKHTGAAGYTVTAKGIKYLLNQVKNKPLDIAIDTLIFEKLLAQRDYKVMQLSPAICIQDFVLNKQTRFKSSLHDGREQVHHNQISVSFFEKIKNEILRIKRKLLGKMVVFR